MGRITTRYPKQGDNWRQNLSQRRDTPEQIQGEQLRNQRTQAQLEQIPLQNEAREAALARAQSAEAKARYDLSKEIETDRQKAAFYNGLPELESNLASRGLPIGTKGHSEAYAAYAHEFPLARSSSDVDQTLKVHSAINDDQAALTNRMKTAIAAGQAVGLQPESASFIKGGDVDVRFSQPSGTDAEDTLSKSRGLTPMEFSNLLNAKQGKIDESGNFTQKLNPGEQANAIQFQAGRDKNDASKLTTHTMPISEFNDYKTAFKQQPVAPFVAPSAATPQPAVTPIPTDQAAAITPAAQAAVTQPAPASTTTPTHLGRYNPKTGEFE